MVLFDLPVYQFIISTFSTSLSMITLMKIITTLGSTIVIVTGILSVAILFKDKRYFKIFLIANLIGVIISSLIKFIVHRPRPTNTMPFSVETSYSFPSGHSMMSMIFYGLVIYYVIKFVKNKYLRYALVGVLSLTIFAVGVSRIYLGVHYATDVVGGFVFGLVYLLVFINVLNKLNSKSKNKSIN